jgi:hypothetical protein
MKIVSRLGPRDRAVVKALCYKQEGRGFETGCDQLIFSIYSSPNKIVYQRQRKNIYESRAWPVSRAENLTAIYEPII